jgi:prepilin-type N-terminal cleavage/methylation domain-containing protein
MEKNRKSGFTLAELIVAIALLAVFGVIVARMYFLAGQIADRTENLDRAVVLSANILEQWQALPEITGPDSENESVGQDENSFIQIISGGSPVDLDLRDFVNNRQDGKYWKTFLDNNLTTCQESDAAFSLEIRLVKTKLTGVWSLETSFIDYADTDRMLYSLQGQRYFAGEGGQ